MAADREASVKIATFLLNKDFHFSITSRRKVFMADFKWPENRNCC